MGENDREELITICGKCKEAEGVFLLRRQNRYCQQCLELSLVNKVRGAVKHKKGGLVGGEKIGICVSGGPSSLCAWYLLDKYISSPANGRREGKKIPFDMKPIYVTDIQKTSSPDETCLEFMRRECPNVEEMKAGDILYPESLGTDCVAALLESVTDLTAKEDLKNILLKKAMLQKARDSGLSHIFMCHPSDTKASEAVAAAAKGQGYALSRFAQTVESYKDVQPKILYCMKDVSLEEVECLSSSILGVPVSKKADVNRYNIHDLAVHFTTMLQESNPGGVSNIMSSIGKLDPHGEGTSHCPLCMEPLHPDEIESFDTTQFAALCDSCKVGIFGDLSNERLAQSAHAQDVFSKLPKCIQEDIFCQR